MVVSSKRFSVQEKEIYDHFLRDISWDWGYKGYNKRGELVPLHANTNQRMMLYWDQCREGVDPRHRAWPEKLSQKLIRAHVLGETTLYVTGDHCEGHWSYRAGDIDCHGKGTLEDAMAFFRFLNRKYFKNRAYWEVSTNGCGIHFWFEVQQDPRYSFERGERRLPSPPGRAPQRATHRQVERERHRDQGVGSRGRRGALGLQGGTILSHAP